MEGLKALRIPLFIVGLATIFAMERYFNTAESYKALLAGAWFISILPLLITLWLYRKATAQGLSSEAKSWFYLGIWKFVVLLGFGLFYVYKWQLGTGALSDSLAAKALLVVWLSLIVFGVFTGIGLELAHRTNGEGETAEPTRLFWSGAGWLNMGLLAAGLFALNYGMSNRDKVFDLSYFKTTKPGESTLKIAAGVAEPIKIGLFFAKDSEVLPFVKDYIETVVKQNPKFDLSSYDKDYAPIQAEEFRVSRNGQIVLQMGDQRQKIDLGDRLENARKKLRTLDSDFQKAIMALTEPPRIAYFTSTHGEMGWTGQDRSPLRSLRGIEQVLKTQNISTKTLPTAFASIPENALLVAIVGPVSSLAAEEVQAIRGYLDKGGKLLVNLDIESGGETPEGLQAGDQAPLLDLLREMGVVFHKEPLVNDREFVSMGRETSLNKMFLFSNVFGSHESVTTLTRNDDRLNVLFFQSGYFEIMGPQANWKPVATVLSTKSTFVDKNRNLEFDKDEVRNSYPIAAAIERDVGEGKKSQVIAFADATLLSDALMSYNGNQFLALDAVRWLSNRMDTAGAIESEEDVKIQHSKGRELFVYHGSIFLIPLLIIGFGFVVNRRKKVRV